MNMRFHYIISRAFNRPLLLEPNYAGVALGFLEQRIRSDVTDLDATDTTPEQKAEIDIAATSYQYGNVQRDWTPYTVLSDGTAIIRVAGSLVHRNGSLNPHSGMTGYDGIEGNIRQALEDYSVKRCVFDLDSPGGEVNGLFELCKIIKGMDKPTLAFVNESAYSACYAIASACDKIYMPEMGGVGSIGVIGAHADFSKNLEASGITITVFSKGKHKADGHPAMPLSKQAIERFDAEFQKVYDKFTSLVAENRQISVEQVKGTEALTYNGYEAVELGLADAVMTKDEAIAAFSENRGSNLIQTGETEMVDEIEKTPAGKKPKAEKTAPDKTGANTDAGGDLKVYDQGVTDGIKAENERIFGILKSPEAEGREATALSFAENGLPQDAAINALKTVPKSTAAAPKTPEKQSIEQMNADGGNGVEDITQDAAGKGKEADAKTVVMKV